MSNTTISSDQTYQKLMRQSGEVIAYRKLSSQHVKTSPGIIFLPGFMSDMNGAKAFTIEKFAKAAGLSFVRFDYFGHGQSRGGNRSA